jgi:NAD(P)-dependent dehydrogenase (short-subunit alcohol dehydrogenase family)
LNSDPVTLVIPVLTAWQSQLDEVGADFVKAQRSSSITRRMASPQEVATMILYVWSREASATTGAELRIDGGGVEAIL